MFFFPINILDIIHQNQKYNLFEQERQNNIKKCIQKRKEMIDNANKPKDYNIKNNKSEGKKIEDKKNY